MKKIASMMVALVFALSMAVFAADKAAGDKPAEKGKPVKAEKAKPVKGKPAKAAEKGKPTPEATK